MTFAHLRAVLDEVAELGSRFAAAEFRIFLVGGIVRDSWLDQDLDASSDIDLTTDARPEDIKQIVTPIADDLWTQGERFGTIGMRLADRDYEVTTHRAESYDPDSRKPQVSFGDSIDADLSRRDFTVNAMAIELPDGDLVDPYGGAVDLEAGVLRTPLAADVSFSDDPLRMLRAARFATKYSLTPHEELFISAIKLHKRLRIVAIERIGVEMRRLLSLNDPSMGLRFLVETGLLAEVTCYGEPERIATVQPRLDAGLHAMARVEGDWQLRLAALGMVLFDDAAGVAAMAQRLRLSVNDARAMTGPSKLASGALTPGASTPAALRAWVLSDRSNDRSDALRLATAIEPTSTDLTTFIKNYGALRDSEGFDVAFLDGDRIKATLDLAAGPQIGEAVDHLHRYYFEHGPSELGEQVSELKRWWTTRATNA